MGALGSKVSRSDAMSVPAIVRGRNLICSISTLPLIMLDSNREPTYCPLLDQIDSKTANVVTLAQTLDDLICESVSWWQITAYDWYGFPVHARHLDVGSVSLLPPREAPVQTLPSGLYPSGVVWVMGRAVDAEDVIRFDSPNDPLLVNGARAIRRALLLAQASEMYATDPEARAYWRPTAGEDPGTEEEIIAHLLRFAEARRANAEAYIPAALDRQTIQGPSAVDIQLAELQKRSDMEIANLLGIDPEDIGVNTTSRTYNNATDRRIDRLNTVLAPFMDAVTQRLSLGDVTRRGYKVVFDLDDYLKADPLTRWSTYGTALDKNVMSVSEVRTKEGLPVNGAPSQSRPSQDAVDVLATASRAMSFAATMDAMQTVAFTGVSFAADPGKRTVSGTLVPFGSVGQNDYGKWRFAPGSIEWNKAAVSRVKLNRDHVRGQPIGAATSVRSDNSALSGDFKIARGTDGDIALQLAEDDVLDGLSVEVDILEYQRDPTADDVLLVTHARLIGVALTAVPAFDDARLTTVHASAHSGGTMPPEATNAPPAGAGTEGPAGPQAPPPAGPEDFARVFESFAAAVERLQGLVPPEQRQRLSKVERVREPMVYTLNGQGHSFVRDAWDVRNAGYGGQRAEEAYARLRKYSEQTAQVAQLEAQRFANAGNTTDQADIIPPGYRPELYVGQIPQGRPLFDSIGTRITLANATSFKVPLWVGSAGLSGTNSEGTGPSTGTITDHTYATVEPTAQSGEFVVTRELMDSSNPAIDIIAMNAMREEYAQDTEALIAAELAGATDNDTGSGQSTEGCYVYTVVGDGLDLALGIRTMEGEFPGHRHLTPDRMLASSTGYPALATAVDGIGRPLFPFVAPGNAQGTVGRAAASLAVDGLACPNAWSLTAGTDDLVLFTSPDILTGESPLLEFTFFEKGGPENIYLNIWGYFCVQILRYTGIHATSYTGA
jgi:HK97 family phage prohead protease